MKKKPDILLLLIVLVIPGMLFSQTFLFKQSNETYSVSSNTTPDSVPAIEHQTDEKLVRQFNPAVLARIDLSKSQTH